MGRTLGDRCHRAGSMALDCTFSGTLESNAKFLVAPKVSCRVEGFRSIQRGGPGFEPCSDSG